MYALTIFLSSFLLFQVQPLIGKYILPWYGGSPGVWTTCMLFFQVMLLAGYGYAHAATIAGRIRQGWIHLGMLLLALPFLPISPSPEMWKPVPGDAPVIKILLLLAATIGVPYLLLSATAPLVQHWFVRACPGRSPYRLYALSNFASLLALLSYPFVVEPRFTLQRQVSLWSWGFAAYAACCAWCALQPWLNLKLGRGEAAAESLSAVAGEDDPAATDKTPLPTIMLWLLLSACGSGLLLATTNQLCQEVAVIPFLWVIPLALYLVTFILCFNSERIYDRVLWGMLLVGAVVPVCRVLYLGVHVSLPVQLLFYLAAMFTCCMACHGELVRLRPHPRHLTLFYLVISAGGAAGGLLVAVVAPLLFHGFAEYPLALVASCLVVLAAWFRDGAFAQAPRWVPAFLVLGQLALSWFAVSYLRIYSPQTVSSTRNFYGVLRVIRENDENGPRLTLMHGRIVHGTQLANPAQQGLPTTYYGPDSAVGLALLNHPRRFAGEPLRVGVVGLGTGTLAVYGRKGDLFRFYEINPEVVRLATQHFTYMSGSAATIETVLGDARISMERELQRNDPQQFDVLVVDAFSSDAIPIHLLTRECFSLYRQHLKPNGLLLVHITNRFLALRPVVTAEAMALGYRAALLASPGDASLGSSKADWMIVTANEAFLESAPLRGRLAPDPETDTKGPLWTDDFAGLWPILKY